MEISFMRSLALLMLLIVFSTLNFGIAAQENLCENFDCGRGTCKNSSVFPFVRCECEKGWKRPDVAVEIPFLPCVIPNCTLNHSCSELAPTPSLPYHGFHDRNYSNILNPCYWDVCGGGTCVPKSNFSYSCDCYQGFGNLMNWTTGYCVRECKPETSACPPEISTVGSGTLLMSMYALYAGGVRLVKDSCTSLMIILGVLIISLYRT
eukprot:Gb_23119 [translate_table: standard]